MKKWADILLEQASFETSRSGGKGGQNVNKVETKVALVVDIESCIADEEALATFKAINHRYIQYPMLRISSEKTRSQLKNKADVIQKLTLFIQEVFKKEKPRKETKIPRSVKENRLKGKKVQGEKKTTRKRIDPKRDI